MAYPMTPINLHADVGAVVISAAPGAYDQDVAKLAQYVADQTNMPVTYRLSDKRVRSIAPEIDGDAWAPL